MTGLGAPTPTMCDKVGAGLNAFAHPGGYGLSSACNTPKPCGKVDLFGRRQRILMPRFDCIFAIETVGDLLAKRFLIFWMKLPSNRFVEPVDGSGIRPPCGPPGKCF
jgi:hypothetical protein